MLYSQCGKYNKYDGYPIVHGDKIKEDRERLTRLLE